LKLSFLKSFSQLSGSLPCDEGSILFQGVEIKRFGLHQRVKLGLARSYKITSLFPSLSVLDHLVLAVQARRDGSFSFWRNRALEAGLVDEAHVTDEMVGLKQRVQVSAEHLAHGEQQMLAIDRALMTNPKLLILDEATEGLAPLVREEIWCCLAELKAAGQTILVIDK
jgi:ABC-type branched-subunit amino acid transport system ATPase component